MSNHYHLFIETSEKTFVFQEFPDVHERLEFIASAYDERILDEITKASSLVVTSVKEKGPDVE